MEGICTVATVRHVHDDPTPRRDDTSLIFVEPSAGEDPARLAVHRTYSVLGDEPAAVAEALVDAFHSVDAIIRVDTAVERVESDPLLDLLGGEAKQECDQSISGHKSPACIDTPATDGIRSVEGDL
jgi:hypothetical protein